MARLPTLLTLLVSLSACFVDIADAKRRRDKCSSSGAELTSQLHSSAGLGYLSSAHSAPKSSVKSSVYSSQPTTSASSGVLGGSSSRRSVPASVISVSGSYSRPSAPVSSASAASSTRPQASGSRSSTKPLPSGTRSTVADSCPPHSTTTKTTTRTVFPTTVTITSDISQATYVYATDSVTSTITTYYTEFSFTYNTTIINTYTSRTTEFSIVPASTTITIPTSPGFTPISCLAAYRDPTVTVTVSSTDTSTSYHATSTSTFIPTIYTYVRAGTVTISSTIPTAFAQVSTTATTTVTLADPTSTVYAACATNNVVSNGPFGSYFEIPFTRPGASLTPAFITYDATACCASCETDPACLLASGVVQNTGGGYACLLIKRSDASTNATCDPTFQAASMDVSQGPTTGFSLFISNSECGQYLFR